MMLRVAVLLLALTFLLAQAPQAAADASAEWRAGQDAFASGDVDSALAFFTSARDQGMSGPAVHYNIAVCQYKLGEYAAARDTFAMIADRFPRMRGLAEYNVGLAEQRLGNAIAAQRRFVAAWYASDDPKVRALAASQLTEIDRDPLVESYGLVSIDVGHDDNVALRDRLGLPAGASASSPMANIFAVLNMPVPAVPGLAFDGAVYAVTYPDADDYNQAELRAGVLYVRAATDWKFQARLHLVAGTLDGSGFNKELNTDARATRFISDAASLELRLRYDEIRGARAMFDGIDGSRGRADLRYRWYRLPHYVLLRAGVENNDRHDAGVSPSRRRLQARYYYQLDDRWEIEAETSYRTSDYDDTEVQRDENLWMIGLGASYDLSGNWVASIRYRYSDNDSDDPLYSYERNQVTVGVRYLFQP